MMLGKITRLVMIVLSAAVVAGCDGIAYFGDQVLAEVGDVKLYRSELVPITAVTGSSADSMRVADKYVSDWVHEQVKLQAAEDLWGKEDEEIERLVENYRKSLIANKVDQYYVARNLDTLITEEMIMAYFEEHKSQFVLDRTVVEGRILRFPSSYRQSKELLTLMKSTNPEKQQDFLDICKKNNFELHEFDSWVDFDEYLSYLPVRSNRNNEYDYLLEEEGIGTMSDNDSKYYFQITSHLKSGTYAPFENVDDAVRKIIYNQRRNEVIKSYEDSLYMDGIRNKEITINIK